MSKKNPDEEYINKVFNNPMFDGTGIRRPLTNLSKTKKLSQEATEQIIKDLENPPEPNAAQMKQILEVRNMILRMKKDPTTVMRIQGANSFPTRKPNWRTPLEFWNPLNEEFKFTLDAAADEYNHLVPMYFTEEMDALSIPWYKAKLGKEAPTVWLNPPYGHGLRKWVKKAYEESLEGCTVVCLLPSSVDTTWFHEYCLPFGEIRFIKGRIKFIDPDTGLPGGAPCKGNILVIFRPK